MKIKLFPLNTPVFWTVFLIATVTFSNWLATFKAFTLLPVLNTFMPLLFTTVCLILSTLFLIYDGYVKEMQTGSIKRRIKLFDWIYQRHG